MDIEKPATPLLFTADEPRLVVPSRNVTVPVGVPENPDVTVAVKVTL